MEQVVRAQIDAAIREKLDARYISLVPKLLELMESLSTVKGPLFNNSLAQILTRYSQCKPLEEHSDLRDFARAHWGDPSRENVSRREVSTTGWDFVSETVREMVTGWLNQHYIQYFFEMLSQDGKSDRRRLDFWIQYYKQIKTVSFALGPHVRTSRDTNVRIGRAKLKDLMVGLKEGSDGANNAFVMSFGEWVAVEYGMKGNACFIFKSSDMPFNMGHDVYAQAVRSHEQASKLAQRLLHKDKGSTSWEDTFERTLSARGIRPEITAHSRFLHPGGRVTKPSRFGSTTSPTMPPPTPVRASGSRSVFGVGEENALRDECRRHKFSIRDMRALHGNLWVEIDDSDNFGLSEKLAAWGFRYKAGKGWWLEKKA